MLLRKKGGKKNTQEKEKKNNKKEKQRNIETKWCLVCAMHDPQTTVVAPLFPASLARPFHKLFSAKSQFDPVHKREPCMQNDS